MKNKIIRIGVPILIVLIIAGIFIFKNLDNSNNNLDSSDNNDETNIEIKFPLEITKVDLEEMKSHGLPIILDFGSDSCDPCKLMAPALKLINKNMQDKAIVQYVDVWRHTKADDGFPVKLIPTQVFYTADGSPFVPSDELKKTITFTIYNHKDTGEHLFTVHEGGLTYDQMIAILSEMGVEE